MIEDHRTLDHPDLVRVVVGVDPPGGATECGIICGGIDENGHGYVIDDRSLAASPEKWASEVVVCYNRNLSDRIVGESNFGGDMVQHTIEQVAGEQVLSYKAVSASRGKAIRAEPIVALYEKGLIHHVGEFPDLEDEMCTWVPGVSKWSPNRLDALVWVFYDLMVGKTGRLLMSDEDYLDEDDE
jgi:phage terminase large subunit-like protein